MPYAYSSTTPSFVPIEIDSLETMAEIRPAKPPDITHILDEDFAGAIGGLMFYHELSSSGNCTRFRVRRTTSLGEEDPATGSAACAFSVWQSQRRLRNDSGVDPTKTTLRYEIEQGVEMGRVSTSSHVRPVNQS